MLKYDICKNCLRKCLKEADTKYYQDFCGNNKMYVSYMENSKSNYEF